MEFISCLRHPEYEISFLYLLPDSIEILCDNCFEDNVIKSEVLKLNKLINIKALLKQPEIVFKKLDLESSTQIILQSNLNYNSNQINEQIREVEKLIQDIQGQIQNMLEDFKVWVKNLENLQKQFLANVKQGFNLDSLQQLIMGLVQSKDVTNPDAIGQLKLKLHLYFQSLQKDNAKEINQHIINKIYQISNGFDTEISKLQTLDNLRIKIEKIENEEYKIATSIFSSVTKQIQSSLFSNQQQLKIISLVKQRSKCEISEIKPIYLGSRDGLSGQTFWAKVNGKKNLLMIFKSKSNYVFGGYSPCQWQQNLNNYVQDNTNSTFLFSQTHDEIYPIANNQYSIHCNSSYGPIFGGGHDIHINADFQDGYSNLGHSYKWDKYQNQSSSHLFGQQTPNIAKCEIFEIQFK